MWAIFPCPGCQTLVHRDMRECPRCGRGLGLGRDQAQTAVWIANAILQYSVEPAKSDPSAKDELRCPECYEAVQRGMVRCWQCRSFLPPFRQE
jgi:hypothetical protein